MAPKEPFRITPSLGPDLHQTGADYYWDMIGAAKDIAGNAVAPSYQLGTKVIGNDGHEYVHVTALADLEEEDKVVIDDATWVATEDNSTGTHQALMAVKKDEAFQARKLTL